ncbi:MAG: aldo/keto reductase [Gemmatimonadetes bacterium]|nr:aldo/keto reductase [Gemmatimonadota bacterium]
MEYRVLGKTGIGVSCIGLGCWPMAGGANWSGIDDDESVATIQHAESLGINLLDTANGYGAGHSERIIGRALLGRRERYVIATKVAPRTDDPDEPIQQYIARNCEGSLERLQTEYIDVYQLHGEPDEADMPPIVEALTRLVEEGKIRCFGISTYETEVMRSLMSLGDLAMAQIGYSIVNPVGKAGLRFAVEENLGTLIRVPLAQGALSGKYFDSLSRLDTQDRRHERFDNPRIHSALRKLSELSFLVGGGKRTMVQAALRFVLDTPGVTSVIPGAKNRAQLEENAGADCVPPLSADERMRALAIGREADWPLPPYTNWT